MSFFENEPVSLYLDGLALIDKRNGPLQDVQVYMHSQLGKVLIINNEVQHVENWMPYYHESIVHIPMMFLMSAEKVLILGGGDLFAAREVLKYNSVQKVVLCDYDENVIKLTQQYYDHANNVMSDPRLEIKVMDAKEYIDQCNEQFDLIIDDCFNLVEAYDSSDIFIKFKSLLTPTGVCSSLIYRHVFDSKVMSKTHQRLISKQKTVLSLVTVPEYPGVLHLLTIWGNSKYLSQHLKKSLNLEHDRISLSCKLFNSKFCKFYLYIPKYISFGGENL